MKEWLQRLSRRDWLKLAALLFCLLSVGGILLAERLIQGGLYDQQAAKRWSNEENVTQISCFFPTNGIDSVDYFMELGRKMDKKLEEASLQPPKESARLRPDALSITGKITVSYGEKSVELEALGVKGDFFLFHPLVLLDGAYFGSESMMQDGIIIDEEAAWQLFGSNDVAGMQVMVGQVPHLISGVVKKQEGRFAKSAGLNRSVAYFPLESLMQHGSIMGGYCYETVMPEPVKGFAMTVFTQELDPSKNRVQIVENSRRFTLEKTYERLMEFGVRSMSFQGIIYPYWENISRGYEDVFSLTLVIKGLLLLYPLIFLGGVSIRLWKKKGEREGISYQWLKDKVYDLQVKYHQKRGEKKT